MNRRFVLSILISVFSGNLSAATVTKAGDQGCFDRDYADLSTCVACCERMKEESINNIGSVCNLNKIKEVCCEAWSEWFWFRPWDSANQKCEGLTNRTMFDRCVDNSVESCRRAKERIFKAYDACVRKCAEVVKGDAKSAE